MFLLATWIDELKLGCLEEEAGEFWFFVLEGVVENITDNWIAVGEEVDADLMSASGDDLDFEEGVVAEALDDAELGERVLALWLGFATTDARDRREESWFGLGASNWEIDFARIAIDDTIGERSVFLGQCTTFKEALEVIKRILILGNDHESRYVLVETVDDRWTRWVFTDLAERWIFLDDPVSEGVGLATLCRMDEEAGWFVDDQIILFISDDGWYQYFISFWLVLGYWFFCFWEISGFNSDHVTDFEKAVDGRWLLVDEHALVADDFLNMSA